jgi:GT2 family glycosyltransferase
MSGHGEAVDVVIPVYKGFEYTRRCLQSVLSASQQTAFEVVVVDDASPEPQITGFLDELNKKGLITLIRNTSNQGYAASVNVGMRLHHDRDVILLNSDTEVNGYWIDRLRHCAYQIDSVGTVTAFSNNATICSYPRFCKDNPLPNDLSLAQLDNIFSEVNAGKSVQVPVCLDSCVYITRNCLDRTGYFDEVTFREGYGEENDFCLRATENGFKHLLCGDVFTYHKGTVSFGAHKDSLLAKAAEKINQRYPHYPQLIRQHLAADPARPLRRQVDIARIKNSQRPRLLVLTNQGCVSQPHEHEAVDGYGLARQLEPMFNVLLLRRSENDTMSVEWARAGEEYREDFRLPDAFEALVLSLGNLSISYLHIHHLDSRDRLLWRLPDRLGIPCGVAWHDSALSYLRESMVREDGIPYYNQMRQIKDLKQQLANKERMIEEILSSQIWRATAPIRWLGIKLKRLARLGFRAESIHRQARGRREG